MLLSNWLLGDPWNARDQFSFRVYGPDGRIASADYANFFDTYLKPTPQWVHVAGVFKPGQSVALYINGVKVAEDTSHIPTRLGQSSQALKIGARADNSMYGFWAGEIDAVHLVGQALSTAEITEVKNSYNAQPPMNLALGTHVSTPHSLLAWRQAFGSTEPEVYLQPFDAQNRWQGTAFNLTHQPAYQAKPALAAGQDGYLVVWQDNRTGNLDIYGQYLTVDGTPNGDFFVIDNGPQDQETPQVAYNAQADDYLVVWSDWRAWVSGNNSTVVDSYYKVISANALTGTIASQPRRLP